MCTICSNYQFTCFNALCTSNSSMSQAAVLAVSFSADSHTLLSASRDHELLFWNAATGARLDGSTVADVEVRYPISLLGWIRIAVFVLYWLGILDV